MFAHPATTFTCRHCGESAGHDPEMCFHCGPICGQCWMDMTCPRESNAAAKRDAPKEPVPITVYAPDGSTSEITHAPLFEKITELWRAAPTEIFLDADTRAVWVNFPQSKNVSIGWWHADGRMELF